MDSLNQVRFSEQMQRLLCEKEHEYGQHLKNITCQTTNTSYFINQLLNAIENITKTFNLYDITLFFDEDSSKPRNCFTEDIIMCYNQILLNTKFSSQYLFEQDIKYGYIVYSWPTLSPYLFIQVIWRIKCEDLIIESIMHLPLDVCDEILNIIVRCINELEISRAKRFVFLLISKLYYKSQWFHLGTLSNYGIADLCLQLITHFEALLNTVSSIYIPLKSSAREKFVQNGIFLKRMLRCIKTCIHYKTMNLPYNDPWIKCFKITYGNPHGMNYFYKLPINTVKSNVEKLDEALVALLLNKINKIDDFEFEAWAEFADEKVNDEEIITISLQQAFITECHSFLEFIKQDKYLCTNEHLHKCLYQFIVPVEDKQSILSVQELCDNIEKNVQKLIKHYKSWDMSTLMFVCKRIEIVNRDDLVILLEYLQYKSPLLDYEDKKKVFDLILNVLLEQKLEDLFDIILQFTLRHFDDNLLTCLFENHEFENFIKQHIPTLNANDYCTILIFVLLHPKKVLSILVRDQLGSTQTEYKNVVLKKNVFDYLRPFFISQLNNEYNMLTYFLNDAFNCDHSSWNYWQFCLFFIDLNTNKIINWDDFIKNFCIPCLTANSFNCYNLFFVLKQLSCCLEKKLSCYSWDITTYNWDKTNYISLISLLIKKISMLRKSKPIYSKFIVNTLLDYGTHILQDLFATPNLLTMDDRNEILKVTNVIEPIDKIFLKYTFVSYVLTSNHVHDVIHTYEERCFRTYQLLRDKSNIENKKSKSNMLDQFDVHSFELDQKALIRHMMLHSSIEEYIFFAMDMTIKFSSFGWANELEAYENILTITTEAMQLALRFTHIFPTDMFYFLLCALVRYCNEFIIVEQHVENNQRTICESLLKNLASLENDVNKTDIYVKMYMDLLQIVNSVNVTSYTEFKQDFSLMTISLDKYRYQFANIESAFTTSATTTNNMLEAYKFVCSCIDDIEI